MKKYIKSVLLLAIGSIYLSSCKDGLDINKNPNSATGSTITPDLVLPNALASTGSNLVTYHNYGSFLVGYQLPGAGISGFATTYSYNFTAADNAGLYTGVFNTLRDYQFIIDKSAEDPKQVLYGAVARIGKAFGYHLVVDAYGAVPYFEGLKGSDNVTPKFDSDATVYQELIKELSAAVEVINANKAQAGVSVNAIKANSDGLFGGDLTKWVKFANSLKLRLLVRAEGTSIDAFVKSEFSKFSADGFLDDDALLNPGYSKSANQNPFWGTYHSTITGSAVQAAQYYIPSKFLFTFYNGSRITDAKRGALTYRNFPSTPAGRLGDEAHNPNAISGSSVWYVGNGTGINASDALGILKGREARLPIFLLAEVKFLLAEAALNGHVLDGSAQDNFKKGIEASFRYLEKNASNAVQSGENPAADATNYITTNAGNALVDWAATSGDKNKQLEAIITQKYIALNFVHGHEAWNEFRRTTFPTISGNADNDTFVSISSTSPRADKLPVRNIYPTAVASLNPNTPKITSPFTDPIFWDKN